MAEHSLWELQSMQAAPLSVKISLTKSRIREWVNAYGEDGVFVSFSGGKDSTVLLDIARQMYPDIVGVYYDTGLEFPEIRQYVKQYDNITWLKPKMNFKQIIIEYGYPLIGKEASECIYYARRFYNELCNSMNIKYGGVYEALSDPVFRKAVIDYPPGTGQRYRFARMAGMLDKNNVIRDGLTRETRTAFSHQKYLFMIDAPFEVNNRCCYVMKKSISHKYSKDTGRVAITAQMASESALRTQQWLHHGCNAFDTKVPISNPMAFWTEQDVLMYVFKNHIPLASIYGDVIIENGDGNLIDVDNYELFDLDRPVFKTTGCERSGCAMCGYGLQLEGRPNRFEMIDTITNPNIRDFIMRGGEFAEDGLWKPNSEGLGYWFPLQWMNVHGKLNVFIPEYEKYEKLYGNDKTREYLIA